jgi:ArsR family transcriptional regulator
MSKRAKPFEMERFFIALSDRTRLRLLNLMGDDEVCVCFFVEILQEPQPKISRHLAYLRRAGIVASRREGKWMHYRVITPSEPHAAGMLREVRAWLLEDREMQRDRTRLVKMCCASRLPVQLQRAPRPAGVIQPELVRSV